MRTMPFLIILGIAVLVKRKGRVKMKGKLSLLVLGVGIILLTTGMNGGCGGGIQVTNYYYYPNWTLDGKIICSKEYAEHKDLGFGKWQQIKTEYYLTVMDEDGENENNIKQINEIAKISYSPLGNYIAYTEGNYIKIIQPDGTDVRSIDCGAAVDSLDWSSNEAQMVYGITTSTTSEIYIIDRDGTDKKLLKTGIDVTWKYGNKIILSASTTLDVYTRIHAVDALDLANTSTYPNAIGNMATINPILATEVFYHGPSNKLQKIDISNVTNESATLRDNFIYWDPKISPNGLKIVCGDGNDEGIWTINIDGTNLKQIR